MYAVAHITEDMYASTMRDCEYCGQPFEPYRPQNRYCQKLCAQRGWHRDNAEHVARSKAAYHQQNYARFAPVRAAWRRRTRGHGHSTNVEAMYSDQGGMCASCCRGFDLDALQVDHDHACCGSNKKSCGECVRGLICNGCNRALAHDDMERMQRMLAMYEQRSIVLRGAIEYLERWKAGASHGVA